VVVFALGRPSDGGILLLFCVEEVEEEVFFPFSLF
jgi:hypothetical protein